MRCICLEENQTIDLNKKYKDDIQSNRALRMTYTYDNNAKEDVYWITPSFFSYHYSSDQLKGTIVWIGSCGAYATSDFV
ncbi:MAG: hypothetical protein LUC50_08595 [Ruminococcus sp.]|nr:hypothetical protein [Ruminococcus sp.]